MSPSAVPSPEVFRPILTLSCPVCKCSCDCPPEPVLTDDVLHENPNIRGAYENQGEVEAVPYELFVRGVDVVSLPAYFQQGPKARCSKLKRYF